MTGASLSGFIETNRLEDLLKLEQNKEIKWIKSKDNICLNCRKITRAYMYTRSNKKEECYCDHCGFDSWIESMYWFNFDMSVLGCV